MANEGLASTYANAVFEEALAQWLIPLRTVAASLKPDLVAKLDDPALAFSKKQELLKPCLPANTLKPVENFLFLLASKNNVALLNDIIVILDRFAQHENWGTTAKVTSAIALIDSEKTAIETKMRAQFGKDLAFEFVVDPAILGGVLVRVGDKVIDGSVAGKLAALQEKLK